MSAATLKAAALALLNSGTGWTKGSGARLANGKACSPGHPNAVRFDIMGALVRAQMQSSEPNLVSYHAVYNSLRALIPAGFKNEDLESYNDSVAWAAVAALFA